MAQGAEWGQWAQISELGGSLPAPGVRTELLMGALAGFLRENCPVPAGEQGWETWASLVRGITARAWRDEKQHIVARAVRTSSTTMNSVDILRSRKKHARSRYWTMTRKPLT